jgi:pimeloyl-ACP methyl ester carboxylesterase
VVSSYLLLNGLRVHYLHWKLADDRDPPADPPVILLHGLASNARIWELVAPRLLERGFECMAPDARGHGLTDQPEQDYSFEAVSRDLAAFVDACRLEKPLLVGHSWGGNVALDYAARFPVGPLSPSGIVLVDGGMVELADSPDATWENVSRRLTPQRLAGTPLDLFVAHLKEWNAAWQPGDEIISIILANFEIHEDDTIAPHLTFEHHMQIVRAMWESKTYAQFTRMRCPVLVVPARPKEPHSANDKAFLAAKERGIAKAHQALPNLQVHWMDDSIHDIPLQRPSELAALIANFATSVDSH